MAQDLPWPALIFMGTGTTALTLWIEVFALKQVLASRRSALSAALCTIMPALPPPCAAQCLWSRPVCKVSRAWQDWADCTGYDGTALPVQQPHCPQHARRGRAAARTEDPAPVAQHRASVLRGGGMQVSAPLAALIYTSEPLWGAMFAWVIAGERWGPRGWWGAALIIASSVASQLGGDGAKMSAAELTGQSSSSDDKQS